MAIRATVWPRPNLQRFTDILDASPNLVKMVVGEKGETLLHRWASQILTTVRINGKEEKEPNINHSRKFSQHICFEAIYCVHSNGENSRSVHTT